MNRKTNIFYNLSDPDNKFLTFSNYTECLTGSFLSVNTKLFPSSFICVDIPTDKLDEFKEQLIYYYENKLATLRDNFIENDITVDNNLCPLGYLIDLICSYNKDAIKYIGDISEQDYNGTYTDIICIIQHFGKFKGYNINLVNNNEQISFPIRDYLYGWDGYVSNQNNILTVGNYDVHINLNEIIDEEHSYNRKMELYGVQYDQNNYNIELRHSENNYNNLSWSTSIVQNNIETDSISFNCVIPLFDIVNTNDKNIHINTDNEFIINTVNKNIPFGIWITDDPVVLTIDNNTQYVPSWSLMITSQFKPFPYSKTITDTIQNKNLHAFNTFASILAEQAKITDLIYDMSNQIKTMSIELDKIKTRINESSIISNSFNLIKDQMTQLEQNMGVKMENLKKELDEKYEALKWQASI